MSAGSYYYTSDTEAADRRCPQCGLALVYIGDGAYVHPRPRRHV